MWGMFLYVRMGFWVGFFVRVCLVFCVVFFFFNLMQCFSSVFSPSFAVVERDMKIIALLGVVYPSLS